MIHIIPLVLPLYPHVWTNPSKILVHLQGAKMKPVCPQSYPARGAFPLWKWAEHFQDLRLKHQNISKRTKYVRRDFTIKDKNLIYPIGSMYGIYANMDPINIYHTLPYMDPMGTVWWILARWGSAGIFRWWPGDPSKTWRDQKALVLWMPLVNVYIAREN